MSGGSGIRTPDPLHAMQVLYQLSYTPKGSPILAVALRCQLRECATVYSTNSVTEFLL